VLARPVGSGDEASPDGAELLPGALERASVVSSDEMPRDVVTMRSRLVLKDVESGSRRDVHL
jgi:hypothetical protein